MIEIISTISNWSIPLIFVIIIIYGFYQGVKIYEVFTEGAAEGIKTVLKIFPYLLAMMLAINIFSAAGVLDYLINTTGLFFDNLNIPRPVIPLLFLRPLSGSGSLSYVNNLFNQYGVDSFIGNVASTIQGSTETTFYIIAVYFGAVGIKKYRYSIIVGIIADIAGFFAAVFICLLLFN